MDVFKSITAGLTEALEDSQSTAPKLKRRIITVVPLKEYEPAEIKSIRNSTGYSQKLFADYMGVSVKTIEAWECGTNHPNGTALRLLSMMENNKNFVDYVKTYDDEDIMDFLVTIKDAMKQSIIDGLNTTEVIPGKLNLERKAHYFYKQYLANKELNTLLYSYALAASEQNASGNVIVTAPTCGSAGVLPGVFFAMQDFYGYSDEMILEALAVAGLVGVLVKRNGSVSGAEVGCQGEVGVACAMAAAAVAFLKGGSLRQIEYAAEIGLEHHLGMTCDPAYGYVQIPCIERNAMGAQRAVDAANYALLTDGEHHVTFDQIVKIMDETGRDLMDKYRETSKGGIAQLFFTC